MSVYGFRFYFTPLTGVLFAFPSRYLFTIGSYLVFSLGSWSTRIPTGFLVPRRTQDTAKIMLHFAYVAFTHSGRPSQTVLLVKSFPYRSPTTPHMWFGLLPVRSPLLRESQLMSVPVLLRWFTSHSIAPVPYIFRHSGDGITTTGLLHSEIQGLTDMCS